MAAEQQRQYEDNSVPISTGYTEALQELVGVTNVKECRESAKLEWCGLGNYL